jgi:hypothetical protein
MGRLMNCENELNELYVSSRFLLKELNFLRLMTTCQVVYLMKKGIKQYRRLKEKKLKAAKMKNKDPKMSSSLLNPSDRDTSKLSMSNN